ncbi:MAG: DegV family protein [Lachnospiraceae bacterium]|nr:DegV family protein [Lachnospiraceae bacterium]
MKKVAIITDSNSGITQKSGKEKGIFVIPMPFTIDGKTYFEDIDLTQEQFYKKLEEGAEISTSQPAIGDIMDLWEEVLKEYDEIVHIPMSSGLSSAYQTAQMISEDYNERVQVVNNQRISVTQKQSVFDALHMAQNGKSAMEIKEYLEKTKFDSSIYITLETLKYLKRGGRITPAAAALGEILRLKPVLQIQGEKLDALAKARTKKMARKIMLRAMKNDFEKRFNAGENGETMLLQMAYTGDNVEIKDFYEEVMETYPNHQIFIDPLSLSVACHLGPGAIAIACTKKMNI